MNCDSWPGAVNELAAPPPGPVTACRSMLCGILLSGWFFRWNSTVSPWRTRMNLPGTCRRTSRTCSRRRRQIGITTSLTSRSTTTFAARLARVGGGTAGANVSVASSGGPSGARASAAGTGVLAEGVGVGVGAACCPQPPNAVRQATVARQVTTILFFTFPSSSLPRACRTSRFRCPPAGSSRL